MKWQAVLAGAATSLLCACAHAPDHFYLLDPAEPAAAPPPARTGYAYARLDVAIPAEVDRPELVVNSARSAMSVLEHERWGAPLGDLVSTALARDIEQRRTDLLVGDRRLEQRSAPPLLIKVDIVRMTAARGGEAQLDVHWRIVDASAAYDQLGNAVLSAPVGGDGYAAVAQAYASALGALADALCAAIPRR
jgi:hypothetical protein